MLIGKVYKIQIGKYRYIGSTVTTLASREANHNSLLPDSDLKLYRTARALGASYLKCEQIYEELIIDRIQIICMEKSFCQEFIANFGQEFSLNTYRPVISSWELQKYKKSYRRKNRKKMKKYQKEYRAKHGHKLNERLRSRVKCSCGNEYNYTYLSRHRKKTGCPKQ